MIELKIGDIIHYELNSPNNKWLNFWFRLQRLFDRGKSAHVALYIGDGKVLEMYHECQIRDSGNLLKNKNIAIQRLKRESSSHFMKFYMSKLIESNLGEKYDYAQLAITSVDTFFEFTLSRILRRNIDIPDLDLGDKRICSELVFDYYKDLGVILTKGRVPTPSDILRSDKLILVKKFGEVIYNLKLEEIDEL